MKDSVEPKIGKNRGNAGKGRPKGALNKATLDIKEAAREYGPKAIEVLANIMLTADSQGTQIAAAKELLDRGYGKATQPTEISGKDGESLGYTFEVVRVDKKDSA